MNGCGRERGSVFDWDRGEGKTAGKHKIQLGPYQLFALVTFPEAQQAGAFLYKKRKEKKNNARCSNLLPS